MTITPLHITPRSAVFEMDNKQGSVYYAPCEYDVYINGSLCTSGKTNVFSVHGLLPLMSYALRVVQKNGEQGVLEFATPQEEMRLDVCSFGAVADGKTDCTNSIQAAISACPRGGTVYLGPGVYYTYPLFLHSDMMLYLDDGAVLLGGGERCKYPVLPGMVKTAEGEKSFASWEGNPLDSFASLITVLDAENVTIAGGGTIDANAQAGGWWHEPKQKRGAWRPRTIFAARAKNLTLAGITVKNSPSWTIHPYYCENLGVYGVHIENPPESPNTDGCNPECCKNVEIIGADISVGDDCISVKSGKYYMSVRHPAAAENITIRNCFLRRGHGAVVVGSEISAGVCGLKIERCLMQNTDRGLRIKTRRGRGKASVIDEVVFKNVIMEQVKTPFVINMFYFCDPDGHTGLVRDKAKRKADELTPAIRNVSCEAVKCTGAEYAGVFIYGLPESPVESFCMKDVEVEFKSSAKPGMPAMMDDLEPVKKRALMAANVKMLCLKNVVFNGYEGECCRLEGVESFTEE